MFRQVDLDGVADQLAKPARFDCIELHGYVAVIFCPAVGLLGRPRRQIPICNLLFRDRQPLEMDLGFRRQRPQRLLDFLAGIDAGGVEVAKVVEINRAMQPADVLCRAMKKRQARVAASDHQGNVKL